MLRTWGFPLLFFSTPPVLNLCKRNCFQRDHAECCACRTTGLAGECSGFLWYSGACVLVYPGRRVIQFLPVLQFGPFLFLICASSLGRGGQQAVWLLATCTLFLFHSFFLPRARNSWGPCCSMSIWLSYQTSQCTATDLAQASSAVLCFEERSKRQLIWFGFCSVLASPLARKRGGEWGQVDWWEGRSMDLCDAEGSLVHLGWETLTSVLQQCELDSL